MVVNSSLIDVCTDRTDITEILVPANKMALAAGNVKASNIAMLGAFVAASKVVTHDNLVKLLKEKLGKKKNVLDINLAVLEKGYKLGLDAMKKAGKKEKV